MTTSYRQDVQGLRAVAVLTVIIYHINRTWLPGGFIGVDLFFVISGFIVSSIILHKKEKARFLLPDFYLGRLKRICPAYFTMLATVSIFMAILLIPNDYSFYSDSLNSALQFNSNHYFSSFGDYFAPNATELPLLHTWSLAVEMQFYLILPLFFYWIPNSYLRKVFFLLFVIFLSLWIFNANVDNKQKIYFSFFYRIPEFCFGILISLYSRRIKIPERSQNSISWFGGLLIFIGLLTIKDSQVYPSLKATIPCLGIILILLCPSGKLNKYLSNTLFLDIGNHSYSLYLWHWPILAAIRYYTERYTLSLSELCIFVLVTIIFSRLSYRYIETPFKKVGTVKKIGNITLSSVVVIACVFIAPILNKSLLFELPVPLTRYADLNKICHGHIVGDCYRGALQGNQEILVLGDSHAAQLNYFFDTLGIANNFKAKIITSSSRITIPGFDIERLPNYAKSPCISQIEIAKKNIETAHQIVLAGMWEYHIHSTAFVNALQSFLSDADVNGKHVLIMGQIPMFHFNISRVYRLNKLGFPVKVVENSAWKTANAKMEEIISSHPSAKFINFSGTSFFSQAPYYKGHLIYFDKDHLNEIGSRQYGKAVAKLFQKEMERSLTS